MWLLHQSRAKADTPKLPLQKRGILLKSFYITLLSIFKITREIHFCYRDSQYTQISVQSGKIQRRFILAKFNIHRSVHR